MNLVVLKCTLHENPVWYPAGENEKTGIALMNVRARNVSTGKWNDWYKVVAYGKVGISCAQHLKAGMKLFILGQFETKRWKDKKTGMWRKRPQIAVRSVTLDLHQWSTEWLDLALQLAAQEQEEPEEQEDATDDDNEPAV